MIAADSSFTPFCSSYVPIFVRLPIRQEQSLGNSWHRMAPSSWIVEVVAWRHVDCDIAGGMGTETVPSSTEALR